MATTTFDKRITIGNEAADVLIGLLRKPAPPRRDVSHIFREMTEEDRERLTQRQSAKEKETFEVKDKLEQLRERAAAIKADTSLRHFPNEADLRVASENARDMAYAQYQAI